MPRIPDFTPPERLARAEADLRRFAAAQEAQARDAAGAIPPGGGGVTNAFRDQYRADAQAMAGAWPPEAKLRLSPQILALEHRLAGPLGQAETTEKLRYHGALQDAEDAELLDTAARHIDPARRDAAVEALYGANRSNPNLPPAIRQSRVAGLPDKIALAQGNALLADTRRRQAIWQTGPTTDGGTPGASSLAGGAGAPVLAGGAGDDRLTPPSMRGLPPLADGGQAVAKDYFRGLHPSASFPVIEQLAAKAALTRQDDIRRAADTSARLARLIGQDAVSIRDTGRENPDLDLDEVLAHFGPAIAAHVRQGRDQARADHIANALSLAIGQPAAAAKTLATWGRPAGNDPAEASAENWKYWDATPPDPATSPAPPGLAPQVEGLTKPATVEGPPAAKLSSPSPPSPGPVAPMPPGSPLVSGLPPQRSPEAAFMEQLQRVDERGSSQHPPGNASASTPLEAPPSPTGQPLPPSDTSAAAPDDSEAAPGLVAGKPVQDFRRTPDAVLQDDVGKLADAAKGVLPLLDKAIAYAVTAAFTKGDTKYIDLLAQRSDLDPHDTARIKEIKAIADRMLARQGVAPSPLKTLVDSRAERGIPLAAQLVAMESAARRGDAGQATELANGIAATFDDPTTSEMLTLLSGLRGMAAEPFMRSAGLAHAKAQARTETEQRLAFATEWDTAQSFGERMAIARKYGLDLAVLASGVLGATHPGKRGGSQEGGGQTPASNSEPSPANESFPDNLSYRANLPQHLFGPDGFTKSGLLSGTHNISNAIKQLKTANSNFSIIKTKVKGIMELKYTHVNAKGKSTSGVKTVYDPLVYPDSEMLDMCLAAGKQAFELHLKDPAQTKFDITQNNINIRVYINFDPTTGNPFVGNAHPIP